MVRVKDIKGYEGFYKAQDNGVIISLYLNKPMETYTLNSGYEALKLTKNGVRKGFQLHRLIAMTFCEGYDDSLQVNHIDGNRKNNKACNLEWVTPKENVQNQIERGTHNVTSAQEVAKVANRKAVIITTPDGKELEYDSVKRASKELGLSPSKISAVCLGVRNHHKGHKARYKEHQVG